MNKLLRYLFIIIVFSSCNTKKIVVSTTSLKPNARVIINKIHAANKIPDWLLLKGKISLDKQEHPVNLSINIKVRKDSVIWASVSAPFGIELFRTMLTKDSLYYLNRTNKTYFVKSINHIQKTLKPIISFDEIERMITATPRIIKQKYKVSREANLRLVIIQTENIRYKVDEGTSRILEAEISDENNNQLNYSYAEYNETEDYLFPSIFELEINAIENFKTTLTYSKIVFDKKQKVTFKIPKSYVEQK